MRCRGSPLLFCHWLWWPPCNHPSPLTPHRRSTLYSLYIVPSICTHPKRLFFVLVSMDYSSLFFNMHHTLAPHHVLTPSEFIIYIIRRRARGMYICTRWHIISNERYHRDSRVYKCINAGRARMRRGRWCFWCSFCCCVNACPDPRCYEHETQHYERAAPTS